MSKQNQHQPDADQEQAEEDFNEFANYVATTAPALAQRLADPEEVVRTLAVGAAVIAKGYASGTDQVGDDRFDDLITTIDLVGAPFVLARRE